MLGLYVLKPGTTPETATSEDLMPANQVQEELLAKQLNGSVANVYIQNVFVRVSAFTFKQGQKVFQSPSASTKPSETRVVHYNLRKSGNSWSRTQTVTHPSTNVAHCRLTSVNRQILTTLRHNS